jgi:hypothetical protein
VGRGGSAGPIGRYWAQSGSLPSMPWFPADHWRDPVAFWGRRAPATHPGTNGGAAGGALPDAIPVATRANTKHQKVLRVISVEVPRVIAADGLSRSPSTLAPSRVLGYKQWSFERCLK